MGAVILKRKKKDNPAPAKALKLLLVLVLLRKYDPGCIKLGFNRAVIEVETQYVERGTALLLLHKLFCFALL